MGGDFPPTDILNAFKIQDDRAVFLDEKWLNSAHDLEIMKAFFECFVYFVVKQPSRGNS
jgi:hypothetical protein